MPFRLIYYAHSKDIYGTKQEEKEYAYINKKLDGWVICPNKHVGDLAFFPNYLYIVKKTDLVVASLYNGHFTRGVHDECIVAIKNNIPLLLLEKNKNSFMFKEIAEITPIKYSLPFQATVKSKELSDKLSEILSKDID